MITVPQAAKIIINRSRYLSEAISKNLINYSSLARYIRPEIEQMLVKEVSDASIMMALKRLEPELRPKYMSPNIFKNKPDITIRSNLVLITNTDDNTGTFKVTGIGENLVIIKRDDAEGLKPLRENLSSITINLPKEAFETSGIYYFFLKSLAWEGINIIALIPTIHELTIVVDDANIERAFSIVKSLFNS